MSTEQKPLTARDFAEEIHRRDCPMTGDTIDLAECKVEIDEITRILEAYHRAALGAEPPPCRHGFDSCLICDQERIARSVAPEPPTTPLVAAPDPRKLAERVQEFLGAWESSDPFAKTWKELLRTALSEPSHRKEQNNEHERRSSTR